MVQVGDTAAGENRPLLEHYRELIAISCRILAQHGLVRGSTGHVSQRIPGTDDFLVRGRPNVDRGLRFAEPSSVIRVGPDAMPVGNTRGVSRVSEIYMHSEIYKRRPDVNAVIHAHPPGAVLCTINNVPLRSISNDGRGLAEQGIPLFHRAVTLQTLEETLPMIDLLGSKDVILLSRHGVVVTGRSVEEATSRALTLETLARMNWIATLHGDPGVYPAEDTEEFARRAGEAVEARAQGRDRTDELHPGGFPGEGGQRSSWPYLKALLDSGALYFDDVGLGLRF
jgi:ribulose-5-phosphate 4-epimerase/fuculose-1-phosphate aldolase